MNERATLEQTLDEQLKQCSDGAEAMAGELNEKLQQHIDFIEKHTAASTQQLQSLLAEKLNPCLDEVRMLEQRFIEQQENTARAVQNGQTDIAEKLTQCLDVTALLESNFT